MRKFCRCFTPRRRGGHHQVSFRSKSMGFTLKVLDFIMKMLDFVPKMLNFIMKMLDFVPKMVDFTMKMMASGAELSLTPLPAGTPNLWGSRLVAPVSAPRLPECTLVQRGYTIRPSTLYQQANPATCLLACLPGGGVSFLRDSPGTSPRLRRRRRRHRCGLARARDALAVGTQAPPPVCCDTCLLCGSVSNGFLHLCEGTGGAGLPLTILTS